MKDLPELKVEVHDYNPNVLRLNSRWRMQPTGKKDVFIAYHGKQPLVYEIEDFELVKIENEE